MGASVNSAMWKIAVHGTKSRYLKHTHSKIPRERSTISHSKGIDATNPTSSIISGPRSQESSENDVKIFSSLEAPGSSNK